MSQSSDDPHSVNPYAAPAAELQAAAPGVAQRPFFYAMSVRKIGLMSVLTMGLYDLCFWWRHWRTLREGGADLSVFWRTVFAGFCAFDFKKQLTLALLARQRQGHALLGAAPLIYLLSSIADNGISRVPKLGAGLIIANLVVNVVRSGTLMVIQSSVNQVLEADDYRGTVNKGATARTYLVAIAGLLIWTAVAFSALFPDGDQAGS